MIVDCFCSSRFGIISCWYWRGKLYTLLVYVGSVQIVSLWNQLIVGQPSACNFSVRVEYLVLVFFYSFYYANAEKYHIKINKKIPKPLLANSTFNHHLVSGRSSLDPQMLLKTGTTAGLVHQVNSFGALEWWGYRNNYANRLFTILLDLRKKNHLAKLVLLKVSVRRPPSTVLSVSSPGNAMD